MSTPLVPPTILAQLRHLYRQMVNRSIPSYTMDIPMAADGLLAPQIAALEQLVVPPVVVKPLIWDEDQCDWWAFHNGHHLVYTIAQRRYPTDHEARHYLYRGGLDDDAPHSPLSVHPTLTAAQEAAQIEWETFIRAALA